MDGLMYRDCKLARESKPDKLKPVRHKIKELQKIKRGVEINAHGGVRLTSRWDELGWVQVSSVNNLESEDEEEVEGFNE